MKETFDTDIIPTISFSAHTLSKPIFLALGKSYTYDGHNRRVKVAGNGDTRYYLYSQSGQLLLSEDNGVQTNYIYLGNRLIAEDRQATTTFIHTDRLGSPVARTNSAGRVESRRHYQPFGDTYEAPSDDIGYTGHKYDNDSGLSYMQARYYDPVIGRFYSNDPVDAVSHLGNAEGIRGFNRYSYAVNNPYKYTDPTGMAVEVSLKAYPIGKAPIVGKYGHAFVEYRDTDTGKSRITRGGPSQSYPGGASDAIMDSSFEGVNLIANDTPASESADFGEAGTETLMSATVDKTMSEVTGQVQKLNSEVNGANIPYQPRGQNSNTYAGNAYQQLTGQKPVNNTDIALPALEKELDK
ncbi:MULTISPECIES: RHS repeat-associated core domain-containing protein [Pseudidiomarina]|uniref:RHS repeat-associated protein n=2 Tax=Pseudidiomarina TaxID=2800384 RepID=A0A368UN93_9GAMM|nr:MULTISPECIES: RHS repeat-associated core domain-containing protein [Pseudidiomarina]PWW10574.1 RHS repeat-associated protein [Pseudidiomarina maritima]RBP88322.1 RHS repeat-associated protein [Pseudidiomarina tainanensis]RCW30252.1 RHS repeat-associated protein [Pseudidiomarina tainanensis]